MSSYTLNEEIQIAKNIVAQLEADPAFSINWMLKEQQDRLKKLETRVKKRISYLKKQIKNECIGYWEIAELQELKKYIDKNDILLLEWAGVSENI